MKRDTHPHPHPHPHHPACSLAAAVLVAAFACGCSKSAEGIATEDITAKFQVQVRNDPGFERMQIALWLSDGWEDLILPDGDRLRATIDDRAPIDVPRNDSGFYDVDLPGIIDAERVTIELTRTVEASAPASTVDLPPPLLLSDPSGTPTVSYSSGELRLTWSNPIDGAEIRFAPEPCDGVAFDSEVEWVADTGSYVLAGSDLSLEAPSGSGQCVSLEMERRARGTVDPALRSDSRFEATRFDYLQVDLTP